jgi:rubredoxin
MDRNKCPVCGNPGIPNYLNEAVVCPHCGSDLKIYRKVSELVEVQTQATDGTKKYKRLSVVLPLIAIAATATVCLLSNPKQQRLTILNILKVRNL